MKQKLALLTLVAALSGAPMLAKAADIDWKKVDAALGKTATVAGDVHRYGLPRSDLQVSLDGVAIKPTLALGGWVAFAPMHGEANGNPDSLGAFVSQQDTLCSSRDDGRTCAQRRSGHCKVGRDHGG